MAAIEGYQCDHCGLRRTHPAPQVPRDFRRPLPTEGYFLAAAKDADTSSWLWLCCPKCVRGYMTQVICGEVD